MERLDGFQTFAEQNRLGVRCAAPSATKYSEFSGQTPVRCPAPVKAGAELAHKGERAAEVDDAALDRPPLRQTSDGLVDHGHEDGARHVRARRALIEQGLHVRLGKYAAARGDGVGALRLLASSFISVGVTPNSVAIWSMNAPVPPAQEPFMRTSVPLQKRIFASSPPSSMMTSVPGMSISAATLVA